MDNSWRRLDEDGDVSTLRPQSALCGHVFWFAVASVAARALLCSQSLLKESAYRRIVRADLRSSAARLQILDHLRRSAQAPFDGRVRPGVGTSPAASTFAALRPNRRKAPDPAAWRLS